MLLLFEVDHYTLVQNMVFTLGYVLYHVDASHARYLVYHA